MVKSKKQTAKKAGDAAEVEVEDSTPVNNEETEKTTEENGIEEVSTKNKTAKSKGKAKKEKGEEELTEKEESEEVVENGEDKSDKSDKKKTPAKAAKRSLKKEPKPYVEPARKSSRTPKPVTKEGDANASFEVEKIIDFRSNKGEPQYLIRWKGYTRGDDSWEDERDLNCPELLQTFKSENPASTKKGKKRPSKSPAKTPAKKSKKDEEDYEVQEIVGMRVKKGKKEFKIRWKGYKPSDDSWEPEKHLSCQDLIEEYLKEHGDEVEAEEEKKPAKKTVKKVKSPAKSAKGKKTKRK